MLRYELRGPAAWLTIDRPDKLNAMTRAFFGELAGRPRTADADARGALRRDSRAPGAASRSAATSRGSAT